MSRASFGPSIIRIATSKHGSRYSNVHASLYQSRKGTKVLIAEAMITQGNLTRERDSGGISLAIASPIPDVEIFKRVTGVEIINPPESRHRFPAGSKVRRILPPGSTYDGDWSHPVQGPSSHDEWISWDAGSGEDVFDFHAIAMLMDNVRPLAYNFPEIDLVRNWMATLSMSMDLMKAPPPVHDSGKSDWESLFLRAVIKKCSFGRYLIGITLLDDSWDVVAIGRTGFWATRLER